MTIIIIVITAIVAVGIFWPKIKTWFVKEKSEDDTDVADNAEQEALKTISESKEASAQSILDTKAAGQAWASASLSK